MARQRLSTSLLCLFLLLAVTRCASPIAKAYREAAAPGVTFPMVLADPQAYEGNTVIWGGTVIRTQNTNTGSVLFVLDTPLGCRDKPDNADASGGRFIGRTDRFLDPLVYAKGRQVTVAGKVIGARTIANRKTNLSYTYPVVQIEQLHLWKKERPLPLMPAYYSWPDPFWGFPGDSDDFYYDEDDENDE
jgi:outer membrane lipoprotein